MSMINTIKECPRCGCPKEDVQYLNSGPIVRIRCPKCTFTVREGRDTELGTEALIAGWNHARERYLEALTGLYEAQFDYPGEPVRVQYDDDRFITGIVTVVDVRKDIFDIEMPEEFVYEDLDIWKVRKVERIPPICEK